MVLRESGSSPPIIFSQLQNVGTYAPPAHIQGIPFFLPLYRKGNAFLFHSLLGRGSHLQQQILSQTSEMSSFQRTFGC
jgi:hypothetical protein